MQFDELVDQYTTYLLKLAFLQVRHQQTAEDIVQETFYKMYKTFGDTIELEHPKSYLVMVTMNTCRDYFKSWHYRKIQLTELVGKETILFETSNEDEELVHFIMLLPIRIREVVVLHYYDEQTTAQIAITLRIPQSTVKTRLQKGRKLLKKLMVEEGKVHA